MSKRFKDFSAAKEGLNTEPIEVKVGEESFTFPPFLTAETILTQLTWLEEDGSIAAPNLPKWFIAIMGEENSVTFECTLQDIEKMIKSLEEMKNALNELQKEG